VDRLILKHSERIEGGITSSSNNMSNTTEDPAAFTPVFNSSQVLGVYYSATAPRPIAHQNMELAIIIISLGFSSMYNLIWCLRYVHLVALCYVNRC